MLEAVTLEILHDPTVNYALQQNDVPIIKQLRITNSNGECLKDLVVHIEVEPDFAIPWDGRVTSLEPGASYAFGQLPLQLSPKFLAELTERVAGTISVSVSASGQELKRETTRIDVLAYDEWSGLRSLPEVLAAFITPNHPVVEGIMTDAAGILSGWDPGASLCAYQTRRKQDVFRQGAAIYEAVRRRGLKYISPPASFEQSGQKVRLAERILEHGLGTCLDLSLFLASCFEQAGLHPLIVFTKGHAFVGFWLVEETFPDVVGDDMLRLRKRVELAEVCLIESTTLTSPPPNDFKIAVQLGKAKLENEQEFLCVVDVARCRKSAIRPLPLRGAHGETSRADTSQMMDVEAPPPDLSLVEETAGPDGPVEKQPETPATRLDRWKRKLLDLSLRNKLLNFKFTNKAVRILCPNIATLEDALADGEKFEVLANPSEFAEDDPRSAEVFRRRTGDDARKVVLQEEFQARRLRAEVGRDKLSRQMLEIYREASLQMEEGGASTLYLALGFLAWHETPVSEKRLLAPLILVPVEVSRGSVLEGFRLRKRDDEARINTTLLELLSKDFQLTLPSMDPVPQDEHGVHVAYILDTFREAVKNIDRWEVVEDACLGFFSFSKFLMWRDLEERTEDLLANPIVSHLVKTPELPFPGGSGFPDADRLDQTHSPTETFCPVLTDSSQLAAVYAAAEGKSFVLHGPPGTGKSQTITNLISHCLACGKSVLFVSEKMAALTVVRDRLVQCGLGSFCLELHSSKSSKQEVIKQLGQSLTGPSSFDSAHWKREAERLAALRAELNEYVQALHKVQSSGETAFQGLSKLIGLQDVQHVTLFWTDPGEFDQAKLDRLWQTARELTLTVADCGILESHPWHGVHCDTWSPVLQRDVGEALQGLVDNIEELRRSSLELFPLLNLGALNEERLHQYPDLVGALSADPAPPAPLLRAEDLETVRKELGAILSQTRRYFHLGEWLGTLFPKELLDLNFEAAAAKVAATCGATGAFPWGGLEVPSWSPEFEREALSRIKDLGERIQAMREVAREVMQLLGLDALNPGQVTQYQDIATSICAEPFPTPTLMQAKDWAATKREVAAVLEKSRRRQALSQGLSAEFTADLHTLDLDSLDAMLNAAKASWGLGRWLKHRAIRKILRAVSISGKAPETKRLGEILSQARELRELNAQWASISAEAEQLLGQIWEDGQATDQTVESLLTRREDLYHSAESVAAMSGRSPEEVVRIWVREVWARRTVLPGRMEAVVVATNRFWEQLEQVCRTLGFPKSPWQTERGTPALDMLEQGVEVLLAEASPLGLWMRWRDALYTASELGQRSPQEQLVSTIRQVAEYRGLLERWASLDSCGRGVLEEEWATGRITDERVVTLFDRAHKIRTQASTAAMLSNLGPAELLDRWAALLHSSQVERLRSTARVFLSAREVIQQQQERLRTLLGPETSSLRQAPDQRPLPALEQGANTLLSDLGRFKSWCHWRGARREALQIGLKPIVSLLERSKLQAGEVEQTAQRGYYQWWVESIIHSEPVLSNFFSAGFEDKIKKFRETDELYTRLTRAEIHARLSSRMPIAGAKANDESEMGVLSGQLRRQRSHMSIRALIKKIPNLLPRLKPCLLMSPMSIAQYMDAGQTTFDLVVFDEASQIPVWDAVGAIARGRQAIIVGDPKQLPPTSFFQRDDEEIDLEEEIVADQESILDECLAARLPQLHLRWHYRSRNEGLIAFSNHQYYDNSLLTFPSPHLEPGVRFHYVPGVYDKSKSRTNRVEAEALVQEMVRRLLDPVLSGVSIGVVTFSQAQRDLIDDLLEPERRNHPEIERFFDPENPERVFIKNLENVQGDERDAIFFSVGYGPDAAGKVSMSFGPLNRDGGERRLNVAVTRARKEVVLFSSLKPEQIDLARTRARGVQDLKCYMEYAERGMAALREAIFHDPSADFDSPFEKQVCEALRAKGHTVHAQVGCSGYRIDLGVVDPECPGRYLLGIECDGANYHRSRNARDRDKLREMVLRGLGWEIVRIWSTDWWQNSQGALAKVEAAIEEAHLRRERQKQDAPGECPPLNHLSDEACVEQFASISSVGITEPEEKFEEYRHSVVTMTLGTQEDFYLPQCTPQIRQALVEVMEREAPISLTLLTRRVAARWGFAKATEKCKDRVMGVAKSTSDVLVRHTKPESFLWMQKDPPETYTGFRVPGDSSASQRDPGDIPSEEIANAVRHILQRYISASFEVLEEESARLFGCKRVTQNIRSQMRRGIDVLAKANDIIAEGDTLVLK